MPPFLSSLQLGTHLGSGHFGDVFEGTDPVHGTVAVKVIARHVGESDPDWNLRRAGFLAEGRNLSLATHPNIVRVFHILEAPQSDELYLVMEYCDGGALQQRYEQGPIPVDEVKSISTDICRGLASLHARGMLHRDIKPGNILLHSGVVKIGDFGLVTDDIILGYASIDGYSDHLPPEVHLGRGTSERSDMWAVGMTMYRLLHGHDWYSRQSSPRFVIPNGGYAGSLKWLPHIPKKVRRLINKLLHDDSASRVQSAQDLFQELSRIPICKWDCEVSTHKIRWTVAKGDRNIFVEWNMQFRGRHEWVAWSEGASPGSRRRRLGGSQSTAAVVRRELENFFAEFSH